MPIYQLRCPAGHGFEVIQSFTAPLPPCRECGQPTAKVPSVIGSAGRPAAHSKRDRFGAGHCGRFDTALRSPGRHPHFGDTLRYLANGVPRAPA